MGDKFSRFYELFQDLLFVGVFQFNIDTLILVLLHVFLNDRVQDDDTRLNFLLFVILWQLLQNFL